MIYEFPAFTVKIEYVQNSVYQTLSSPLKRPVYEANSTFCANGLELVGRHLALD